MCNNHLRYILFCRIVQPLSGRSSLLVTVPEDVGIPYIFQWLRCCNHLWFPSVPMVLWGVRGGVGSGSLPGFRHDHMFPDIRLRPVFADRTSYDMVRTQALTCRLSWLLVI